MTGRHVEAGYILRTFAHYVRDGLIPNMFPEGTREGLYHTADATPLVLPRARPLRPGDRGSRDAPPPPADARVDRRPPRAGHAVRHRRRPGGRAPASGRRGVPAHVDGCQGRRLGGDPAARQGGRDQRALVQRAPAPRGLDARGARRRRGGAAVDAGRSGPRLVQRALLVRRGRLSLRRGRRRERGRSGLPAQSALRDLALQPRPDRGAVGAGPGGGPGAAGHAGRAADPRAGPSRTTRRRTTGTSGPGTPPTTRARSGPG